MAAKKKSASKKKPKETKVEEVEASVGSLLLGDNQPPIRDLMYHYETILGFEEKAATARSKVTDAKKKAKESGVDVTALMQTKALLRLDPLDLAVRLRQQSMLLSERGSPVQVQLFEPKFGTVEEQAGNEGWNDGLNGKNINIARWAEGTPGHKEYVRRYNDSQKEIVMRMVDPAEAE